VGGVNVIEILFKSYLIFLETHECELSFTLLQCSDTGLLTSIHNLSEFIIQNSEFRIELAEFVSSLLTSSFWIINSLVSIYPRSRERIR
jgi:hypothetical protein